MFRPIILTVAFALGIVSAGLADDAEPTAAKVKKLQAERRDLLKKVVAIRTEEFKTGRGSFDAVIKASKGLLQAELEMATTPKERLAAHAARLELAKQAEARMAQRLKAGLVDAADYLLAQADRLEAEIGWLKAGGEKQKSKKDK